MAEDQRPIGYVIRDAIHWFMMDSALNTEREGQEPFSDEAGYLLVQATGNLLEDQEPRAYAVFEDAAGSWVLIVVGESAYSLRLLQEDKRPSTVEIRSLGTLRGKYTERWSLAQEGERVEVLFEPFEGAPLEFELSPPEAVRGGSKAPEPLERREQLERLRLIFQAWSRLPATP